MGCPFLRCARLMGVLDDLTSGEGSLWLLPGSHRKGYHVSVRDLIQRCDSDNEEALTPAGIAPMDLPGAISVRTKPGDVIFFNQKLAHSSWCGPTGRRFLGVTWGEKPTEDYHFEWIMHHAYFGEKGHLFRFQSGHPSERSDAGWFRMG